MSYVIVKEKATTTETALDRLQRSVNKKHEEGYHCLAAPGVVREVESYQFGSDSHRYVAFQAMIKDDEVYPDGRFQK